MTYHAFISYSHAADGKLAPALQSGLQRLAKPWFRLPILKVFRDQTSLSANPGLWSEIERNLAQSEHFILLASEGAARSVWVEREAAWWIANRSIDKLLIVVTDGEVQWSSEAGDFDWTKTTCLPMSLKGRFSEESLFVDLRWARGRDDLSLRHSQFRTALLDLAAPLHGKPKDELDSEDIRQNRRLRRASWSAGAAILVLAVAATIAAWIAVQKAVTALSQQHAAEAQLRIRDGRLGDAVLSGLQAWRTEDTMEARTAIFETLQAAWDFHAVLRFQRAPVKAVAFRKEGEELLTWSADNTLVVWDVARRRPIGQPLRGAPVQAGSAAFSPDAQLLATGTGGGAVVLWEAGKLRRLHELRADGLGEVTSLAFNADGTLLAAGYFEGAIVVWDLKQRTRLRIELEQADRLAHDFSVPSLSFSKEGRYLAAANWNPSAPVAVWELATGELVSTLSFSTSFWVNESVAFLSRDEGGGKVNYLVITSTEGTVTLYREAEGGQDRFQHAHGSRQHEGRIPVIAVEDGVLATGGEDGRVSIWGDVAGQPVIPASWTRSPIRSLAFSPFARYLAAGTEDGAVMIYHGRLERPRFRESFIADGPRLERSPDGKWIMIHQRRDYQEIGYSVVSTATHRALLEEQPGTASFSRDGRWLVTTSREGTGLWDLAGQPPKPRPLLRGERQQAFLAPASDFLVTETWTTGVSIRVWELGHEPLAGHVLVQKPIAHVRGFTPDGKWLLIQSQEELTVWDLAGRKQIGPPVLLEPLEDEEDRYRIEVSPDSRWILAGMARGRLSLHRIGGGEEFPLKEFYDASFSPDGKWLVTEAGQGEARIWDLRARVPSGRLLPLRSFREIALSPDGRWLVAADEGSEAVIWDLAKLERHGPPLDPSRAQAFSPDGRLLAMGNLDRIVLVDVPDARVVGTLQGHAKALHDIAFSPDGRLLASIDADGSVILWDPIHLARISEALVGPGEDEDANSKLGFDPDGMTLWADGIPLPAHPWTWTEDICQRIDPTLPEEEWRQVFGGAPYPWTCDGISGVGLLELFR